MIKVKSALKGTAAVCLFAWCFHSNDVMAADSIVIECDPSTEPGVIIMTDPPKVSCDDLDLINLFVGTGLKFGPITDMEQLKKQIAAAPPVVYRFGEPIQNPQEARFEIRRDRAFKELSELEINAALRSVAPGYLDDSNVFPDVKGN